MQRQPLVDFDFDVDQVQEISALPPLRMAGRTPSAADTPPMAHLSAGRLAVKRGMDITIALLACVLMAPVVLVIAVAVKSSSPGPVFFCQDRVGRDGRVFRIIKFRTMRDGTHRDVLDSPDTRARYIANDFKLPPGDPHITSVGCWLRQLSLDELPQFVNVLLGHMSVVGIRPIEPAQLNMRAPADQAIYETMRPGLTGIWQINGRSTMDPADRVTLDNRYVEEWSVWGDVKIMLRTPFAVLRVAHAH